MSERVKEHWNIQVNIMYSQHILCFRSRLVWIVMPKLLWLYRLFFRLTILLYFLRKIFCSVSERKEGCVDERIRGCYARTGDASASIKVFRVLRVIMCIKINEDVVTRGTHLHRLSFVFYVE